ncbi:MAG: DUF721 domain-containing protein [Alphaproteobacteria bacterium TMED93]|nr:MAG: DUF721 domain-containing protein [Alphaproteobacteria bacterium TMED93]
MKDYFKNLNTITQNIKRKIYKKKDTRLIIIMENWEEIVGKDYYKKSNPLKITRDQELKVEVSNDILLDFSYSNQMYINKIDNILGYEDSIKKIFVVQKYF